ncbi:hypothetical protein SMICM304S_02113 [Streptomyces microflavus]
MILLLSTSDTDLLSARASEGPVSYRYANPSRVDLDGLPELLDGTDLVVVRLLGGVRAWQEGLDAVLATGRPVVVLTGEQAPDAQLMAASTVPIGIAAEAHAYLAHGGPANLEQLARFLSDTVLLTGHGFEPPAPAPAWGPLEREARAVPEGAPTVAVLYYRAHHMSGNTAFIDALCTAVEDAGARPLPLYVASLRTPESELIDELRAADAIVTTVLAAGGTRPAEASAGGDDESWDAGALTGLDVPILQALCLTSPRAAWEENDEGVSPLDAATQIAVPEFDGRLITVPFSFKEIDEDGLPAYVADAAEATGLGGYAYGRELDGRPAREEMETAYKRIEVAAKNTDTGEHDIADSDDYFQYHGGMVATVRALKGKAPEAYIGDSTRPETVRTRTLVEETSRVFRAGLSTPSGSRRCAATATRARSSSPPPSTTSSGTTPRPASSPTGCTTSSPRRTSSTRRTGSSSRRPTPGLCTASQNVCWRPSRAVCRAKPDPAVLEALRQVYLETEGNLEGED